MRGDQLARQWRLIQRLARSRYGVGLDDLAEDLEVTRRTVYRDLDALMYAGFPVTSEKRDGRVFYRLYESFELADAPFTADEVLALAFAEDLLGILEGTVFHDSIHSAMQKVRASLGPELVSFLESLQLPLQLTQQCSRSQPPCDADLPTPPALPFGLIRETEQHPPALQ